MRQYQAIVGQLQYGIFCLLLFTLPYGEAITRPLWVAWLIAWALEGRWMRRPKSLNPLFPQSLIPFAIAIAFALFLLWQAASAHWAIDAHQTHLLIGRQINLLAVAVIALWGLNDRYEPATMLKVLIAGAVLSVPNYQFFHFWIRNWELALDKHYAGPMHDDPILTMQNLTFEIFHHTYYGTILALALLAIGYVAPREVAKHGRWQTYAFSTLVAVVLLLGIFWSGSRQILLSLALLAPILAITKFRSRSTYQLINLSTFIIALSLAIASLYAITHQNTRFNFAGEQATAISYHPEQEEPANEPRVAEWHVALEHCHEYLAKGIGAGCNQAYMVSLYEQKGWTRYVQLRYNCHNQYLCEAIELGLAGAIFFTLILLMLPFAYRGETRRLAVVVIAIFALNCLTENYLSRIDGILQFSLALLLLMQLQVWQTQNKN